MRSTISFRGILGFAVASVLGFCALAVLAPGEQRVSIVPRRRLEPPTRPASLIRVHVRLVMIPVTVTDPLDRPYAGLKKNAFRLFEDGVEQKITYFATEDAPVSMGLVFDASGSMRNKLDKSREAIRRFFETAMPGDEYFLVQFNDSPLLLSTFTSDTNWIENELAGIRSKGWTSLIDAIYLSIHEMKHARNSRKALLVLSDGADNNSRYSAAEVRDLVRESEVCIYAIGMLGGGVPRRSMRLLESLAEATGGRLFPVEKKSELPEAAAKISAALRNQYTLGYSSNNPRNDGKYRKVEVRLVPPPQAPALQASWRTGYYAPGDGD